MSDDDYLSKKIFSLSRVCSANGILFEYSLILNYLRLFFITFLTRIQKFSNLKHESKSS